jgi:hypothetical protein
MRGWKLAVYRAELSRACVLVAAGPITAAPTGFVVRKFCGDSARNRDDSTVQALHARGGLTEAKSQQIKRTRKVE